MESFFPLIENAAKGGGFEFNMTGIADRASNITPNLTRLMPRSKSPKPVPARDNVCTTQPEKADARHRGWICKAEEPCLMLR